MYRIIVFLFDRNKKEKSTTFITCQKIVSEQTDAKPQLKQRSVPGRSISIQVWSWSSPKSPNRTREMGQQQRWFNRDGSTEMPTTTHQIQTIVHGRCRVFVNPFDMCFSSSSGNRNGLSKLNFHSGKDSS